MLGLELRWGLLLGGIRLDKDASAIAVVIWCTRVAALPLMLLPPVAPLAVDTTVARLCHSKSYEQQDWHFGSIVKSSSESGWNNGKNSMNNLIKHRLCK